MTALAAEQQAKRALGPEHLQTIEFDTQADAFCAIAPTRQAIDAVAHTINALGGGTHSFDYDPSSINK